MAGEMSSGRKTQKITSLRNFTISREGVTELRFLLYGADGAGKSSIINTIKSIFEGHQLICLSDSNLGGIRFTQKYQKLIYGSDQSGHLPFVFYDVRGLQEGVCTDDIIKALKGHLPDNYKFNSHYSSTENNEHYISKPTLDNKIHCLVSVVAADKISLMDYTVIEEMRSIKEQATKFGIPQVLFMTRVDKACNLTEQDLSKIYQSKKIKDKITECSNRLGITENCIFPVKNYHKETKSDEKINCLMLDAFSQIVTAAHDYVKKCSSDEKFVE